jgi:hypothetical protein
MEILSNWKGWTTKIAIVGGILALYPAAQLIGLDLPRPAWSSEVSKIVDQVQELKVWRLESDVNRKVEQVWEQEDRPQDSRTKKRLRVLQLELEAAKSRLKKVRGF